MLDNGRLLDHVLKKKWYSSENSPQGAWDKHCRENVAGICREWTSCFPFNDSIVQGVLSKARGEENCLYTSPQIMTQLIRFYRIILSVNQLSVCGAVAAICEEFEDHQDRTGEPVILMGQSIVLGEVKAETPLQNESPMNDQIIWQQVHSTG